MDPTIPLLEQIESMEKARDSLETKIRNLTTEKKQLAQDNKIALEDIQHMTRLKEERLEIDKERFEVKTLATKDGEVLKIKNDYRTKLEKHLEDSRKDLREMYSEILARLPNINVKLGGDVS